MLGRRFRRSTEGKDKPIKHRDAPQSPYLKARSNFESLFRKQAKEKHAWKFVALGELVLLGTVVAAYIHLASTSRIVPYVVEVDELGQAVAFLNEYFADPEHNPHQLARDLTRNVQVTSVLPIPNSDSWRVQWTETEHPRGGRIGERRAWEAYLTVNQVPPEDVETIQMNPLGLYVTGINWTPITQLQPEDGR